MYFEIIGKIENVEIIAAAGRIRDIMRLRRHTVSVGGENSKALQWSE